MIFSQISLSHRCEYAAAFATYLSTFETHDNQSVEQLRSGSTDVCFYSYYEAFHHHHTLMLH